MTLTSIERFHLLSGSPVHPNSLYCRIVVARELRSGLLEDAIEHVLDRHHLLSRRLARQPEEQLWIEEVHGQASLLTWVQGSDSREALRSFMPKASELESKIDLHSTPGTHVWCLPLEFCSVLFFAIHHSVTDGLGATRIANELLITYDNLTAGRAWDDGLRSLDASRLQQRHRIGFNRWSYWKHLWKQPIAVAGMAKFFFRSFQLIGRVKYDLADTANDKFKLEGSGLLGRWVSEELSARIDHAASKRSVSTNSISMAAVFYALPIWLRRQNERLAKKWLRMVLPISVATKEDLRSPISNRATIVQIDRCEDQMQDLESFIRYLDREVKIIVGWQFDKLFLLIVRMMSISRWWLRRSASNPRARGTIVFTNLGQPFRSIDKRANTLPRKKISGSKHSTEIIEFDCAGPIRNAMPLNFTIQRHQRRYRISVRFDRRVVSIEQAGDFLQQVEAELNRIAKVTL
jgi:hypothetical protein